MIFIILNIPFYKNDEQGNQCLQAGMRSLLHYFLNTDYSLEELDRMTNRRGHYWTWSSQVAVALHDLGLRVKLFSKSELAPFLQGESFIKEHFGNDAEKILKHSDLHVVTASIRKLINYRIFEKRTPDVKEIEGYIRKRCGLIALLDWNKITGDTSLYQGHAVVITGFDENNFFIHHSGPGHPKANMVVSKTKFLEAWNSNGTDNDLIVVYGKR